MKTDKTRLALTWLTISATLGFMIALQYKSTQQINDVAGWNSSNKDVQQATDKLTAIQKENKALEQQLNDLNKQIVSYEQEASKYDTSDIKNQLSNARILAGTTPVEGPGIVLTVDDNRSAKSSNPVTHDTDVMRLVNELFLSGAEVVSINGERVGVASGIMCVGPTVRVNDRLLTAPYKIEAIGDPATLIKGLTFPGGMLDVLSSKDRGLQIQGPKEMQKIKISGNAGIQK
ncbi:DUF881 domain-containing protein [Effusibacillus dendaii]|uniref:Dihydropteridine reductase n=1 Tax=Effusibacillus dendaii TaxID=2743772 RepID=A0A7I8DAT6_9BACL|nr:DUF881 domain-containing protein [Effusibacillus dendaii]BCJ86069.1 dihydropteridine reductase [Effusibacillus dendaii]